MVPILATLLQMGLPYVAEAVTGMATDKAEEFIKDKTGVSIDLTGGERPSVHDLEELKKWNDNELKTQVELNRHEEEVFKLEIQDLMDAREMGESYLQSEDKFLSRFIAILTLVMSLASFGYLTAVTFIDIPKENIQTANMITGAVLSIVLAKVFSYWFGTSNSSAKKDAVIANKKSLDLF